MKSSKAEQADKRVWALVRLTFVVLLLIGAALVWCVVTFVPAVPQTLAGLPGPIATAALTVPVLVIACGTIPVYIALQRQAERAMGVADSPVASWAQVHGWKYRYRDDGLDDDVWQAAFSSEDYLESALDVIKGRWADRQAWAFVFHGGAGSHGRSSGQAVVMKMRHAWPGRFEASRVRGHVGGSGTRVEQVSGWYLSGDITGAGSSEVIDLLNRSGFAGTLSAASVPKAAVIEVGSADDAGEYVALVTDWTTSPNTALPVALDLLRGLATTLENAASADGALG